MNYAFIRYIRRKNHEKSSCYLYTLKDYTLNRREYNNSALDIICQIAYKRIKLLYLSRLLKVFTCLHLYQELDGVQVSFWWKKLLFLQQTVDSSIESYLYKFDAYFDPKSTFLSDFYIFSSIKWFSISSFLSWNLMNKINFAK